MSKKKALAIIIGVLAVFVLASVDWFFSSYYIMDGQSVASTEINYRGIYGYFPMHYMDTIELKSKENIETILAADKAMLEYEKYIDSGGQEKDYRLTYNIIIRYHLLNGKIFERNHSYDLTTEETTEILSLLDLTDEYKTQIAEYYKKELHRWEEEYAAEKSNIDKMLIGRYAELIINTDLSDGLSQTREKVLLSQLYDNNFFERFAEVYADEIMDINESNYPSPFGKLYIFDTEFGTVYIPVSFENTLQMLDEFGFDVNRVDPPVIVWD